MTVIILDGNLFLRLLDVYKNKVNSFTQLTDAVLAHHHKSPQLYTVLVQDEDVSIIPKSQVPQEQRFPKVCTSERVFFATLRNHVSVPRQFTIQVTASST